MNKSNTTSNTNKIKAEDIFNYLSEGFLHGNQLKKSTTFPNEIRIGITYV